MSYKVLKWDKSLLYEGGINSDSNVQEFRNTLNSCKICPIRNEARQVVLSDGDLNSKFIFIGRNPGIQEDMYGLPFSYDAQSTRILDFYFKALNIYRFNTYLTNACFCHTNRDRVPLRDEIKICSKWKNQEFSYLKNMRYVFLLGPEASQQFLGYDIKFEDVRNIVFQSKLFNKYIMFFPVYHPGFLIRNQDLLTETIKFLVFCGQIIKVDIENRLNWF
jgi:uracil-DNA glycosylase family 4